MCSASVNVSNDIIIPVLEGQSLLYSVQTFHFTFMQPCYFTPFCPSTCYVDLAFISVRKEGDVIVAARYPMAAEAWMPYIHM